MKLTLNTWQRMMCVQALNAQAGHITMLRKALKLCEVLELSAAEQAAVGLAELPGGGFSWQDQAQRFDLEIGDRELVAFLKRAVGQYQNWPVGQAALVLELFDELEIDGDA